MIKVVGGSLYQWDTGRKVSVQKRDGVSIAQVHFSHSGMQNALVTVPQEESGGVTAEIPNILLQSAQNLTVYAVVVDSDERKTIIDRTFSVVSRPKPEDYVYTETEVLNYDKLEKRIKKIEETPVDAEQVSAAVGKYLEENPITETDPTVPVWAKNPQKPSYDASEVGADPSGTAANKVSEHNTAIDAHNDIRLLVHGLTTRLNALADSDDDTLDQMSEVVAYIKSNKALIDAITTQKVNVADIIDNLTTNVGNKPLSASQGVKLKGLIDAIVIPEKLPNPGTLKFIGAVTETYDGSADKTIDIPLGGGTGGGGTVSVEVASTTTGEPGTGAQVTNSGDNQNVKLNFIIPKGSDGATGPQGPKGNTGDQGTQGPKGETGATPNIQIGDVQTLEPGQQATASMSGTPENPLLNLGIPKGEKGDPEESTGGGSYTLPIMSDTQLGGGKAIERTTEDVPVAVDTETGQLFVPTYPSGSGYDTSQQTDYQLIVEKILSAEEAEVTSFTFTSEEFPLIEQCNEFFIALINPTNKTMPYWKLGCNEYNNFSNTFSNRGGNQGYSFARLSLRGSIISVEVSNWIAISLAQSATSSSGTSNATPNRSLKDRKIEGDKITSIHIISYQAFLDEGAKIMIYGWKV